MPGKFSSWLQGKGAKLRELARKQDQSRKQDESREGPNPWGGWQHRPSVLTPTPSRADLVADATAESGFFQRLPPEIRRKVLAAAFGGWIVHMSLEYGHPRQLFDPGYLLGMYGAPLRRHIPPGTRGLPWRLHCDPSAPKGWQWRGCACWTRAHMTSTTGDNCIPGIATCWEKASDVPQQCLVGAIGWLTTCRQAYVEGIEVLYSTNAFHFSNEGSVLLRHLKEVLSPSRLAMIASIDLYWTANDLVESKPPAMGKGRPNFLYMLEAIPKVLPNLRRGRISIFGCPFPLLLEERPAHYDRCLFEPVDGMVRKLVHIREFFLAVPYTIMEKRQYRAIHEGREVKYIGSDRYFWRPLPSTGGHIKTASEPLDSPAEVCSKVEGYWVTESYFDDPYPLMGCFGSGSSDPERHDAVRKELNSL